MGALDSLKILDFSTLLPGPYATMLLADLGADVIRVTSKGRPDITIEVPPFIPDTDLTAAAAWLGRNKRSMYLNLKKQESLEIVYKLVQEYDIVVEQFRPGVMDRLGVGYEALKKIKPDIIYCSLTGYGQTGKMRDRAGHDINYLARSGTMSHSGRKSTGPVLTSVQMADVAVGSMNTVVGILCAAIHRAHTGEGQYIDVAMLDGMVPFNGVQGANFLVNHVQSRREGEQLNGGCLYDFYQTKDGRYLSVGCLEQKFFENFCDGIEMPELKSGTVEPDNVEEVKEKVRNRLMEKTCEEWMEIFSQLDACVEPVMWQEEAFLKDDHIQERDMVVDVELPLNPGLKVKQIGNPIKLSACPADYRHAAYPLGYHTEEIIRELHYSPWQYLRLKEKGIFD